MRAHSLIYVAVDWGPSWHDLLKHLPHEAFPWLVHPTTWSLGSKHQAETALPSMI